MTHADRVERLVAALDVFQETVDPCADGHVEHGADAHLGRRLVHTYVGGLIGADWDYDAAVEYIRASQVVAPAPPIHQALGHGGSARASDGRWVSFATKKPVEVAA